MALILLRHTRTDVGNSVCYGASDVACAADFAAASETVIAMLPPVDAIVTSPLARCRRLAEAVSACRAAPLTTDERLREMTFGAWEGRPWAAIDRADVDAWAADFYHARPHGGESVAMLAARVADALADLRGRPGTTLIVTHLGVIRAVLAELGRPEAWEAQVGFGEWLCL